MTPGQNATVNPPAVCACTQFVAATLAAALACPALWYELPDGRWSHIRPAARTQGVSR